MALAIQLDLFEPNDEISMLHREIAAMKDAQDRQRKSLFAKQNDLAKMYIDIKQKYDALERQIHMVIKNR